MLDNVIELTIDVKNSFYEKKVVLATFLDVSSAYDSVKRDILINKLKKDKCPVKILKYIDDWIKWKKVKFIVGKEEDEERLVF